MSISSICSKSCRSDGGGLLPQKAILVGAFGRGSALQAAGARWIFAIAAQFATAALRAGHRATAPFARPIWLRRIVYTFHICHVSVKRDD